MEFVKLLLSQSYEGYSYINASDIKMGNLGIFLTDDVGYDPEFYKKYVFNNRQQFMSSNATTLEKQNGYILLSDQYPEEGYEAQLKMSHDQFIKLLDDWEEKVCTPEHKEVIIKHENDELLWKQNIKTTTSGFFMKLSIIFLTGLLASSHLIVSTGNHGIYYNELKVFKNTPDTKALFKQDVDGISPTTQDNLGIYNPTFLDNGERRLFSQWDIINKILSLGNIKRQITISKQLSFIDNCLLIGLCGKNDDLIIVTDKIMPALYDYVSSLSKEAKVAMPFLFISLKNFSISSRKILGFRGSIVIGQQLLYDLSDEELEALIAQQIGHIKYYHTNKKAIVNGAALVGCIIPALSSLLVSKRFAKQADIFTSEIAKKANGLIRFYKRLEVKDQLRIAEYDEVSKILMENAEHITMLSYLTLILCYYMTKTKCYVEEIYNKFAYPSHQERIDSAKKYLAQQEI